MSSPKRRSFKITYASAIRTYRALLQRNLRLMFSWSIKADVWEALHVRHVRNILYWSVAALFVGSRRATIVEVIEETLNQRLLKQRARNARPSPGRPRRPFWWEWPTITRNDTHNIICEMCVPVDCTVCYRIGEKIVSGTQCESDIESYFCFLKVSKGFEGSLVYSW